MNTQTNLRQLSLSMLTVLLLFGFAAKAHAQVDTAAPMIPIYGVDLDEFIIAAQTTKWVINPSGNIEEARIWDFVRDLGLNTLFFSHAPWGVDAIYDSPYRQVDTQKCWTPASPMAFHTGMAKEIRFYPFDSVQSPYFVWKFTNTDGGTTDTNTVELNNDNKPILEQVYENLSDTGLVASTIAIDWTDTATRAMQLAMFGRWFIDHRSYPFIGQWLAPNVYREPLTYYTVIIGHLFAGGAAADTDTIFTVAIYHEMPEGHKYLDNSFQVDSVGTGGLELLVDSFAVTRAELRTGFPLKPLDEYRTISHPTDLRYRLGNTSLPGPLHPSQPAGKDQAIDIRVYWTGKEKAALHAVALRDSTAELMLGTTTGSDNFRDKLMKEIKRLFLGNAFGSIADLRTDMISLQSGEEAIHHPMEFAAFEALHRMMRDTFNLPRWRVANGQAANPQPGDSIGLTEFELADETFHHTTTATTIHTYEYFNYSGDTIARFYTARGDVSGNVYKQANEVLYHAVPSIKQRNGGRYHLPEFLDLDSVGNPTYDAGLEERIDGYEESLQRLIFGRYDPGNADFYADWPNRLVDGRVDHMGDAARLSRRTGRRWIPLLGPISVISLRDSLAGGWWEYDTTEIMPDSIIIDSTFIPIVGIDTLVSHTPTENELFATMGMELGFGARGIFFWQLQGPQLATPSKIDTTLWITTGQDCCWGPMGYYTRDTVQNVLSPLRLYEGNPQDPSKQRASIPNLYVGWFDGYRAIKALTARLQVIGPEMAKYRWRDGYSIHFTVPRAGSSRDTIFRPIPSGEIITEVRSRSPFKSQPDSLHRTYVEMGLFDKVTDSTGGVYDPLKDRHIVYLTNRRSFRKPIYGCWDDTCTGAVPDTTVNILDTLAGTRIISCRLNLTHPDTTSYNLWRVREIKPDIRPLPHAPNVPRHTLDTVLAGDSVFNVMLGPGMSTAVEISPALPDTSLIAGDLRWPGQRKLIWNGLRYVSVVGTTRKNSGGGLDSIVVMRLSYIMADSTGSIIWIPGEFVLSDPLFFGDTVRTDNRFPSFTLHRQGLKTWLTAIWTCHPAQLTFPGDREVVIRNIMVDDYVGVVNPPGYPPLPAYTWEASPLRTVDWHSGTNAEKWGTPVVGLTDGSVMVAWSDSVIGIVGRLFAKDFTTWTGPLFNPTFSARDSISWVYSQTNGGKGSYPSVPPWTPFGGGDSTLAIVWRHSNDILYQRLEHTPTDAMTEVYPLPINMTPGSGTAYYPSIDISQYTFNGTRREGVVWEEDIFAFHTLQFQSLQTSSTPSTGLWNRATYVALEDDSVNIWPPGELFPQTAVLGEQDTSTMGQGHIQYGIGYQIPEVPPDLWHAQVNWGQSSFRSGWPQQYSYGGQHPNIAANVDQSWPRFAVLYQATGIGGGDSTLRTSRQFFAKHARPVGYAATGRDVRFRVDDSSGTGFHVLFYDPWFADANNAAGLPMVRRDSTLAMTDSITQVAGLFRTEGFSTSDSVTVGCRLFAGFHGDSALAAGERVDLIVELVDSVTGNVVAELDSITVSAAEDESALQIERTLDLLSGTYYVRLRFGSPSFPSESVAHDCLYPVAEVAGWIANPLAAKGVRRLAGDAEAGLRVAAQPNPFTGETEIRFSVGRNEHVTLTVYDAYGREVRSLIGKEFYPPGRYAVEFSGADLPSGTYLVELRTLNGRVTEKVVLMR